MAEAKILRLPFVDGLVDFMTGLGGARDRTTTTVYGGLQILDRGSIDTMYRSDWIARKIVDIVPQDMVRTGRKWRATKEQITAIEDVEQSYGVNLWPKLFEALIRARLIGGAGVYIGVPGQNPATPLDPKSVSKGAPIYLTVLSMNQLRYEEIERDPSTPTFGDAKMWTVSSANGQTLQIHPTRIIKFVGSQILNYDPGTTQSVWGDPILQIVFDAVRNAASTQQHVAGLVPDSRNDVLYIPGLGRILQDDKQTEQLTKRFGLARSMKSNFNILMLEGNGQEGTNARGEKWEQRTVSFTQLPELIRQFLEIAAGAADIPITRFLGQSPGGENSTGEADMRNYYDHVHSLRVLRLAPALKRLDDVVMYAALGARPPEIFYDWPGLWAINDKEKATIFKDRAIGARNIVGATGPMIMDPRALSAGLVNATIEDGTLPGLEDAIDKFGELGDVMDDKAIKNIISPPPPPPPIAAANSNGKAPAFGKRSAANDKAPSSLFVSRKVLNTRSVLGWARAQGISNLVEPEDLHVTVLHSKTPVDWLSMGNDWQGSEDGTVTVPAGGPRIVEPMGDVGAALQFSHSGLQYRHMSMVRSGASHDFPDYTPHVTLSKTFQAMDMSRIEPYRGTIELGPERFEEVKQ